MKLISLFLINLVAADIDTKKKHHDEKLTRNYATNTKKYSQKDPWLNKKFIFNYILIAYKREKSNAALPPP